MSGRRREGELGANGVRHHGDAHGGGNISAVSSQRVLCRVLRRVEEMSLCSCTTDHEPLF